jgi:RsiW-degrading membrane proteinase PrsW (M82 family)
MNESLLESNSNSNNNLYDNNNSDSNANVHPDGELLLVLVPEGNDPRMIEPVSGGNLTERTPHTVSIPVATAISTTATTTPTATTRKYKGFSTSICDLFHTSDPLHKEDCCAFACCGILARERNAFFRGKLIITNPDTTTSTTIATDRSSASRLIRDPNVLLSVVLPLLLLLPLIVLLLWVKASCSTPSSSANNVDHESEGSVLFILLFLLLGFCLLLLICYNRYYQAQFRQELVNPHRILPAYRTFFPQTTTRTRQDSYDADCAHPICCCGWYTRDDDNDRSSITNDYTTATSPHPDLCTVLWKLLSNICCGSCFCRCWFQCCGCCATAQETRQIKLLLAPTEATQVDYITHQSYSDYYPKIQQLRRTNNKSFIHHLTYGTSKLSQGLLFTLLVVILLIYILDFIGEQQEQQQQQQTIIINDDNNNAYNTFFPFSHLLVFLTTFLQPFLVLLLVHWQWNRFDISVDAVIKYFASGFLLTTGLAMFIEMMVSTAIELILSTLVLVGGDKILLSLSYLMFNAYISAAFVEELCKYFGYWMVEHPDFSALQNRRRMRNIDAERVISTEETPLIPTTDASTASTTTACYSLEEPTLIGTTAITYSLSERIRSHTSLGCAITIAMISVSLGFACCENLLYVFVYSPQHESITVQLSILGIRCLFPIHPLAAAIQSISVCRRDLEGDPTVGIGRILLPSILLHGTFDFSLLLLSWIGQSYDEESNNNNNQSNTTLTWAISLLCLGVSISVVLVGLCYYFKVRDPYLFVND